MFFPVVDSYLANTIMDANTNVQHILWQLSDSPTQACAPDFYSA